MAKKASKRSAEAARRGTQGTPAGSDAKSGQPRTAGAKSDVSGKGKQPERPSSGTSRGSKSADETNSKVLSAAEQEELLAALHSRFEQNRARHQGIAWAKVQERLRAKAGKLRSLHEMGRTGGEPDVVAHDARTGEFIFFDCSAESPAGRRSVCYDREGLESRKEHRPHDTAVDMAAAMGIELLTEEEYRELQELGEFDTKTSSWIKTPRAIRELGGALFCDRRYDTVFVYHNGAQSYYAVRGFRGSLRV